MLSVIIIVIIVWGVMWGFYKFMYPRAPQSMMPKAGDVTTPRVCDFCGNSLAQYRGVLEETVKISPDTDNTVASVDGSLADNAPLFFCNYEHQADFHAGKTYQ